MAIWTVALHYEDEARSQPFAYRHVVARNLSEAADKVSKLEGPWKVAVFL